MTLQWTLVAVILYIEIGLVCLLMLPWIRPPLWQKIFKSRLIKAIEAYSTIFYYSFGAILIVLFFDAVRETRKYSHIDDLNLQDQLATPHAETMMHMRLFRAQRNLYIAGFAVFLYLVARRMMQMIIKEAQLMASAEASMKQAQGASAAANLMLDKSKPDSESKELKALEKTIAELQKELTKAEKDRDSMKEQAEGVKREYDRLNKEFQQFQEGLVDPDEEKED